MTNILSFLNHESRAIYDAANKMPGKPPLPWASMTTQLVAMLATMDDAQRERAVNALVESQVLIGSLIAARSGRIREAIEESERFTMPRH
jgi:hypothetical protein